MGLIKTLAHAFRSLVGLPAKPVRKKSGRRRNAGVQKRTVKAVARKKKVVRQRRSAAPRKVKKKSIKAAPPAKKKAGPAKNVKVKRLLVGEVTHYFDRVSVAAFMLTGAPVALGDKLEFESSRGILPQKIISLQINRQPVKKAVMGDEVGLKVSGPVKEGDQVFKIL